MLNPKNFKGEICSVWKKLSKLDFNYYNSLRNKIDNIPFNEFSKKVLEMAKGKKVVINGGHFIPNSDDYEEIGENPIKTWELACKLTDKLKKKRIDAKVSIMLNDIGFTIKVRKKVFKEMGLPKIFEEILKKNNLTEEDVLHCGWNRGIVYTEKKLSNRIEHLIRRNKLGQKYLEANNYCISALTMYYLDLLKQGIEVSIFILPKCGWRNYKKSVDLFKKLNEKKLIQLAYFETENCFL